MKFQAQSASPGPDRHNTLRGKDIVRAAIKRSPFFLPNFAKNQCRRASFDISENYKLIEKLKTMIIVNKRKNISQGIKNVATASRFLAAKLLAIGVT
jgi:hypothetical protein